MTLFVDVPALSKLVNQIGIKQFITGMENSIREDFLQWESFEKCSRLASHSEVGVIELMPVAGIDKYSFKYVNGHPANTQKGKPTVMAFGALADVETGYPEMLAELTLTTAFRTAATSVMAARALARKNSSTMGMIGCGAQSEFQALAFHYLLGIKKIKIFDIDEKAMKKLQRHLSNFTSLEVQLESSAKSAVKDTDIVTVCTADKRWATILTEDMIEPGMHINAIGGDCPGKTELSKEVLLQSKIFVEYEPQTRVEGDIQQLPKTHPVYDLWKVLADKISGRDFDTQITLFDSVGFALEDYSAMRFVQQLMKQSSMAKNVTLIPELTNPKDLYGFLQTSQQTFKRSA